MKSLFLICIIISFLLNCAYVKADLTCPTCLVENQNCTKEFSFGVGSCGSGLLCYPQSQDSSIEWTCQKYIEENQECTPHDGNPKSRCNGGFICSRETTSNPYVCVDHSFAQLGESCKLSNDCIGSLKCNFKGVCSKPDGGSCDSNLDCNYDENCVLVSINGNARQCNKTIDEGQPCTARIDKITPVCSLGLTCLSAIKIGIQDGTCEYKKKLNLGEMCTYTSDCDFEDDYYCSNNICQKLIVPSPKVCNETGVDSCGDFQECSCKDNKCYQDRPFPSETWLKVKQCAYDHGCVYTDNLLSHKSCVSKHCRSMICDMASASYPDTPNDCKNQYMRDLYCNFSFKFNPSFVSIFLILIILNLFV